jgi:mannose-6-phosphate isomerase
LVALLPQKEKLVTATRLTPRRVHKPWGRRDLPPIFGAVGEEEEPVGEVWFSHPQFNDAELLVKYLFTSERLSIQVHPGDDAARLRGYPRGKDEAWLILSADPGAQIGIGTSCRMSAEELGAAVREGSIERMLVWHPVKVGDIFYSPAGTIHAIGAGLVLIEVQQNVDLTYRLYDYGRPRELHLDESVAVAQAVPYDAPCRPVEVKPGRLIVASGPAFVIERCTKLASGTLQTAAETLVWRYLSPAVPASMAPISKQARRGSSSDRGSDD